jgi:hypothetical protein
MTKHPICLDLPRAGLICFGPGADSDASQAGSAAAKGFAWLRPAPDLCLPAPGLAVRNNAGRAAEIPRLAVRPNRNLVNEAGMIGHG